MGIPRTLLYYSYFPLWRRFFTELGATVVTSSTTTKRILDAGVRTAVTDACMPVKLLHGHVVDLIERGIDYIFLPRVVCTNGRTVYCPKFLGLPDMVRSSITDLPELIDVRYDNRDNKRELKRVALEVGNRLSCNNRRVKQALEAALADHRRYSELLHAGVAPAAAIKVLANPERTTRNEPGIAGPAMDTDAYDLRFAVIGYPYEIYDPYISLDLLNKLRDMRVMPLTANTISKNDLQAQQQKLYKNMFWTYSEQAVLAAHHYFEYDDTVDGLIHVTAFSCGPDSIVNRVIGGIAKEHPSVPFMTLMIDEHTGEAGLMTRLEAFTDMVRRRQRVSEKKPSIDELITPRLRHAVRKGAATVATTN
ncbi:MAG TPA: acyl-CoA dehydratase activase-related protein [Candidatus Aquicultor sp.]